MCTPKAPSAPPPTPVRAQTVLPNNGDPSVRADQRRRTGVTSSTVAMAATLGSPVTSNPLGMTNYG